MTIEFNATMILLNLNIILHFVHSAILWQKLLYVELFWRHLNYLMKMIDLLNVNILDNTANIKAMIELIDIITSSTTSMSLIQ